MDKSNAVSKGAAAGQVARKGVDAGVTGAKVTGWFLAGFWQGLTAPKEEPAPVKRTAARRR